MHWPLASTTGAPEILEVSSRRMAWPRFSSAVNVSGSFTIASQTRMGLPEESPTAPSAAARGRHAAGARREGARRGRVDVLK